MMRPLDIYRLKQTHYAGIQITADGVPAGKLYFALPGLRVPNLMLFDLQGGRAVRVTGVMLCDERGKFEGVLPLEVLERVQPEACHA